MRSSSPKKVRWRYASATGGSAPGGKREVTFTVTDTGIGIPDDKKDLLFRIFSQVDESHSRSYGGTGLGLAISKEIVERMGGTISFTSEEGKGSTFSCTIPFGEVEVEHDAGFTCKVETAPLTGSDYKTTTPRCRGRTGNQAISRIYAPAG